MKATWEFVWEVKIVRNQNTSVGPKFLAWSPGLPVCSSRCSVQSPGPWVPASARPAVGPLSSTPQPCPCLAMSPTMLDPPASSYPCPASARIYPQGGACLGPWLPFFWLGDGMGWVVRPCTYRCWRGLQRPISGLQRATGTHCRKVYHRHLKLNFIYIH